MSSLFSDDNNLEMHHDGKFVTVRDYAMHADGQLVYLQIMGSRIVLDGIAASLFTSGKRNKEVVVCEVPDKTASGVIVPGVVGVMQIAKVERNVSIAAYAVGSMKKARVKLPDSETYGMTIYTEMMDWDYHYRHVQQPAASDKTDLTPKELEEISKGLSRFVMRESPDTPDEVVARRWMGYLVKRHRDGLYAEWAYPLWKYCIENSVCVKEYETLICRAWLWEPERDKIRNAVRKLGLSGELVMPAEIMALMESGSELVLVAD